MNKGDRVITGLGRPGTVVETYRDFRGRLCADVQSDSGHVVGWHAEALRLAR